MLKDKISDFLTEKGIDKAQQVKFMALLIALLALAVILLVNHFTIKPGQKAKSSKRTTSASRRATKPKPSLGSSPATEEKEIPSQVKNRLKDVGRDDPFTALNWELFFGHGSNAPLVLLGIVWDEKNPQAVFIDSIVSAGDVIRERKVLRIEKDRILLEDDGVEVVIRIGEAISRK